MCDADGADWRRTAEGRRTVFVGLVHDHHADMVRLAYAIGGDPELAADAAQSAWQAAWQELDDLRDLNAIRPWLLSITANQAKRLVRRRQLGRLLELRASDMPTSLEPASDLDLVLALARLSLRDRQLVGLRFGLGLTSEEIGAQMGLSASGVRVRLGRLLRQLRKDLTDE